MAHTAISAHGAAIGTPREIVAYTRVSRQEQRVHGLGLEAQLSAIEDYAHRTGSSIVASYTEAATGRRDTLRNRPELVRALGHAKRSGALLVFARWDRLSRNVSVTAQLLESSIDFVAVDNPYANRLTIHILAAMAEYESRLKSERIRAVFAYMKANGHRFRAGKFAPGVAARGNAAACQATRERTKAVYADLVPLIVALRERGDTLDEIAEHLNRAGHRNQRRHPWSRSNVWMLLRREGYQDLAARRKPASVLGEIQRLKARQAYTVLIPLAVEQYRAGLSTAAIAVWLNEHGYKTSRWNTWTTQTVRSLLRREGVALRPRAPKEWAEVARRGAHRSAQARRAKTLQAYERAHPIAERLRAKGETCARIALRLNRRAWRSPAGKPWDAAKVWAMLNRRDKADK